MLSVRLARQAMVFAFVVLCSPPPALSGSAEDSAAAAASQTTGKTVDSNPLIRLNFVDRQRMLNEMTAKALCFTDLRVDRKGHSNQLSAAKYVFESTLEHLTEGSKGLGLAAESRPHLLSEIEELKLAWVNNAAAINGWFGARWGKSLFAAKAFEQNEVLNKRLTQTIETYHEAAEAEGGVDPGASAALLIAGGQRMMTQRIGKELCQIAAGYQPEETRKRLQESLALFAANTEKIAKGDKESGLTEEPPGLVLDNIEQSKSALATMEPVLDAALAGNTLTREELAPAAVANMKLLRHWEQIVSTYELLD